MCWGWFLAACIWAVWYGLNSAMPSSRWPHPISVSPLLPAPPVWDSPAEPHPAPSHPTAVLSVGRELDHHKFLSTRSC